MKWDKGVDFEYMYALLSKNIASHNRDLKSKCYDSILLIQLRNGARISEAIRAYIKYITTRSNRVEVEVSKSRKSVTRLMVIPNNIVVCHDLADVDVKTLANRVKIYALHNYKVNTHSLRYAFITYLLEKGVSPAIIAKITKHQTLRHILTYTQQKVAEQILLNLD